MATRRKRTGKNANKAGKRKKATKKKIAKRKVTKSTSVKRKKSAKRPAKKKKSATRARGGNLVARETIARAADTKEKGVVLKFSKSDGSPDDVRVTLQNPTKRALKAGEKTGESDPRSPGDRVAAVIQVTVPTAAGGGRTATIDVTNTTASPIVVAVPEGRISRAVTTTLTVVSEG